MIGDPGAAPPRAVVRAFSPCEPRAVVPLDAGHIHRSWLITAREAERFVLQRLNARVFEDGARLVHNARRITRRLDALGVPTIAMRETGDGELLVRDDRGNGWRAYAWIDGRSPDVRDPGEMERLAGAYGRYAAALGGLGPAELDPTIAAFHDLDHRVRALRDAVEHDPVGRARSVRRDIDRCRRAVDRVHALAEWPAWAALPVRVAHNDATPANAVLRASGDLCIIDLDTTMPGTVLADVGELLRTTTRVVAEHGGASAGAVHLERVATAVRAWLIGWAGDLHPAEAEALPIAGIVLTLENAVRFLTDHLDGDRYFRIAGAGHNLTRSRSQLAHAEAQLDAIDDLRRVAAHAVSPT